MLALNVFASSGRGGVEPLAAENPVVYSLGFTLRRSFLK